MKMYFNDFNACINTLELMVYQLEENFRNAYEEYGEELPDTDIRKRFQALKDTLTNNAWGIKEHEKEERKRMIEKRKAKV